MSWPFAAGALILRARRGLIDLERLRVRCVFSETLNGSTLDAGSTAPLGRLQAGLLNGEPPGEAGSRHAVSRVWRRTLSPVQQAARSVLDDLITTCFPADCRACGGPLLHAGFAPVCDDCVSRITPQTMTLCRSCGEAIGMESDRFAGQFAAEDVLCTMCRFVPPPFERAVAYGVYQDELREMVHLLKYERMRAVAKPLGAMLARAIATLGLQGEVAVVAVPLYPAKEQQRGYNQSALLAEAAMACLRREAAFALRAEHGALRRVRDTESQFALTPRGRRMNLRGALVADAQRVAGRTVLLIDDIYTTGATARECARVLRKAGVAKVLVATLARAQTEQVAVWEGATN